MAQLFANNAFGSLGATLSAVSTTLTLATGQGVRFPTPTGGDHFLLTLVGIDGNGNENAWEIVKVTGRASDALTVVRGQEGTTAALWASGARVEMRATKGTFDGLLQLLGGTITGPVSVVNGAYTALKVGVTGLVSVGGEAGSSEAKFTITDAGNVGLEFSPTAVAGSNRILSYNRASMAFVPMMLMALSHKFNVSGTDMLTVDSTGMSYTGTLTGGTGVVNLGSGQFVKDASGNVGVGDDNPSAKLSILGDTGASKRALRIKPTNEAAAIDSVRTVAIERSGNDSALAMGYSTTRDAFVISSTYGSTGAYKPLVLATSDQDRVTVDPAGNFGLGMTPSAWSPNRRALQIGGSTVAALGLASGIGEIKINSISTVSGYVYATSNPAGLVDFNNAVSGGFSWRVAPSGTAGNPITFTQAMTLDASGVQTLSATAAQQIIQPSSTTNNAITRYINGGGTAFVGLDNSSGGIGGAYSLNVWHNGAYPIIFGTSGSERARIDSSGNLNINTTGAAGNRLYVVQSGTENVAARFQNSSNNFASNNIYSVLDGAGNATTAANHFVAFASGADVLAIRGNGNVVNTNNSYGAISDLKLKDNVVDVTPKLQKLLQVRIVNYTLKADPNKTKLIGVIAQELEQISPGLIEETPDYEEVKKTREVEVPAVEAVLDAEGNEVTPAVPATTRTEEYTERVPLGTVTKSVKYSVFVPMLIKGMQEQQAQIEALQSQIDTQNTAMQLLVARLEALEAK